MRTGWRVGARLIRMTTEHKVVCPRRVAELADAMNEAVPKHIGPHAKVLGNNLYWHFCLPNDVAKEVSRTMEVEHDCIIEAIEPEVLLFTPPVDADINDLLRALEHLEDILRPPNKSDYALDALIAASSVL